MQSGGSPTRTEGPAPSGMGRSASLPVCLAQPDHGLQGVGQARQLGEGEQNVLGTPAPTLVVTSCP